MENPCSLRPFETKASIGWLVGDSLTVSIGGVGLLGALVERYGLRHVHRHGHVAELVFTFGLAFLIEELVQFFWGRNTLDYQQPDLLDFPLFTLFGQEFSAYRGFMIFISLAIFIGL